MNVRDRINFFREQRNWTINHLASEAELNAGTVQNWFKRKSTPTIECIESICKAFGISLSEFFNEYDAPPTYLTYFQQEMLTEFDLLHNDEKEKLLHLLKAINRSKKKINS